MTTVVNIRDLAPGWERDPQYAYVGRPGRGLRGDYGNPHPVGPPACALCRRWHRRGEAVEVFRSEAAERYRRDAAYRALVERLRGKRLVCFCAPERCHGEVYVELLRGGTD